MFEILIAAARRQKLHLTRDVSNLRTTNCLIAVLPINQGQRGHCGCKWRQQRPLFLPNGLRSDLSRISEGEAPSRRPKWVNKAILKPRGVRRARESPVSTSARTRTSGITWPCRHPAIRRSVSLSPCYLGHPHADTIPIRHLHRQSNTGASSKLQKHKPTGSLLSRNPGVLHVMRMRWMACYLRPSILHY